MAGVVIGVFTRMACGEQAYHLPGGAVGAGLIYTSTPMIPGRARARLSDYLINIANCEVGYYAGVFAADYFLNSTER